jgi:hypothetical protein
LMLVTLSRLPRAAVREADRLAARVYDRAAVGLVRRASWGCGAAGSAPHWQCGGQGFESPQLHPYLLACRHSTRSPTGLTGHVFAHTVARVPPGYRNLTRLTDEQNGNHSLASTTLNVAAPASPGRSDLERVATPSLHTARAGVVVETGGIRRDQWAWLAPNWTALATCLRIPISPTTARLLTRA